METIERVLAILEDIERAGTKRVLDPRIHAAILDREACQFRLASNHLSRNLPAWPRLAPMNDPLTFPGKAVASKANAVAHRRSARLDHIEEAVWRIDDHRAGLLACRV